MPTLRKFATPVVMGAFLLSATTGVLMFFELGQGMNHLAHEWLGLAFVVGVGLHVSTNWAAFKVYFAQKKATTWPVVGLFALLLVASFAPQPGQREGPSPARMALTALSMAPLTVVAQVAKLTPQETLVRVKAAGFEVSSESQSVADVAGADRDDQGRVFEAIFKRAAR